MTSGGAHPTEETGLLEDHESSHSHAHKSLGEDVPLYSRPRQRQRWDDHQILPHVNWGDLFFDLFYVGAAYNLAVILKASPSWEGFLYFISCYLTVSIMWNEKLGYDSRYAPEDNLFHRSMEVFHLLVLGTAIQHIRPVEMMKHTTTHSTTFVFCLSATVMAFIDTRKSMDVHSNVVGGDEAKHDSANDYRRKLCGLIAFFIATLISGRDFFLIGPNNDETLEGEDEEGNYLPIIFCLLAFVAEQAYILIDNFVVLALVGRNFKEVCVPMNLEFTLHRLGEWTMLMLGESVLSLLIVEQSAGRRYYVTFYSGIISVTLMQYLYFRSNPFEADDHAMRRDRLGGFQYYYSMKFYSASLIIIGCSFKLILHHYLDEEAVEEGEPIEEDEPQYPLEESARRIANMFSWSMAESFFFLDLMIVAHRGWSANFSRVYSSERGINWPPLMIMILDYSLLVVTATFSQWITDLELLSVAGCLMVMCQVVMRTRGLRFFPVTKKAMDHAHRWPNVTEPAISS